jgi:hypothetical protein
LRPPKRSTAISSRHKKRSFKDEPIDLEALEQGPNLKGLLSFLDRSPDDYARLFQGSSASLQLPDSATINSELPGSDLFPDTNFTPDSNLLPDSSKLPDSSLPPGSELLRQAATSDPHRPAGGQLLSGGDLRTSHGRIVRVRQARSVQDAHTSAEHLLLQVMWKKAAPENDSSRLLKAGLSELSRWTGAHKTSCRDYLRSLIQKLAIEEVGAFRAAPGSTEGARTFRVFSFDRILERRRFANFTHVVRTGAVNFVNPQTGERLLPGSNLPPGASLLAGAGSSQGTEPGSSLPPGPGSNQHRTNKNEEESIVRTSSAGAPALVANAILSAFGFIDDDAISLIVRRCREKAPDATDEEIAELAAFQCHRVARIRKVGNPVGLLIDQVPRCFEGERFARYRRKKAEAARRLQELYDEN